MEWDDYSSMTRVPLIVAKLAEDDGSHEEAARLRTLAYESALCDRMSLGRWPIGPSQMPTVPDDWRSRPVAGNYGQRLRETYGG